MMVRSNVFAPALTVTALEDRVVPNATFQWDPDILVPVDANATVFYSVADNCLAYRAEIGDSWALKGNPLPAGLNISAVLKANGEFDPLVEVDEDSFTAPGETIYVVGEVQWEGHEIDNSVLLLLVQQGVQLEVQIGNPTKYDPNQRSPFDLTPTYQQTPAPATPVPNQSPQPGPVTNDLNGDGFDDSWVIAPQTDAATAQTNDGSGGDETATGDESEDADGDGFPDDWVVAPVTP